MKRLTLAIFLFFVFNQNVFAADHVVDLTVSYKLVNFAGKERQAITVNNQIPAPTLHFKQGDHVTIKVHNKLDKDTAIHWHGIILPWQMDGVEGVTQKGIMPGKTFAYEFNLEQSGTYWYHAHAGLQEQEGLYGAFIIDPPIAEQYSYTKDFVVVLSDWSNTPADQIFANLKKEGDYYSPDFPLQPSLAKFIQDYKKSSCREKQKIIDDYKMMQQMRMSIYDYSDVAYDAFLLNGHSKCNPWTGLVKVGETVRLRFIGAGASTIFHVKISGTPMQMVHAQGNDVKPYEIEDFTVAPGETYDVLVNIKENKPYVIYAESIDTVGAAYGALVTAANQKVNYKQVKPFPEPPPVTREMMDMMMGGMRNSTMDMAMPQPSKNNKKSKQTNTMDSMSHDMHDKDQAGNNTKVVDSDTQPMNMDAKNPDIKSDSMTHKMSMEPSEKDQSTNQATNMDTNMPMDHSMHQMQMDQPSQQNMQPMDSDKKVEAPMNHSMQNMNANGMNMANNAHTSHGMVMGHSGSMDMPTEPSVFIDTISAPTAPFTTSGTKYQNLIAAVKTNDPNKVVNGEIKMELFGYMDRFIWFINGKPEYEAHPYILEPGKRYRFVFTNNSMMHHPMHIHGHWFILRKGSGEFDPLLHTIDVAPGATITADVDTDASGQWFFHCHMLYHMFAGMSRVFQYSTLLEVTQGRIQPQDTIKQTAYTNRPIVRVDEIKPIDKSLVKHPMAHPMGIFLANFLDVGTDPFHNVQKLNFRGLYGPDYNKLELFINDAEMKKGTVENADLDIFYWHLIDQFWAVKAGANYFYRPAQTPYWQPGIGIEGLMPYFIDVDLRAYYHSGSAKFDLELTRDSQITNNFFIRIGARSILATKTVSKAQIGSGLNQMRYIIRPYYRIALGIDLFAEYEYERNYGSFRNLQNIAGEPTVQNTITLGIGLVF